MHFFYRSRLIGSLRNRPYFGFSDSQNLNYTGYKEELKRVLDSKKIRDLISLNIVSNNWMKAFNITEAKEIDEINNKIKELIQKNRKRNTAKRKKDNKPFFGRKELENQGIDLTYKPNRTGRRMLCVFSNKDLRKNYLNYLKALAESAREIYKHWEQGATSLKMPIWVLSPALPVLCNLV